MPAGPQALEDVDGPMPSRLATLQDPGTPDQIVLDQHSLTHFSPSLPLCKVCVESRGRDSPHREPSKRDAVVPQLQFDYGQMGDGGPLQIACFLVGTDTSSGPMFSTMVPDSEKMDILYVVVSVHRYPLPSALVHRFSFQTSTSQTSHCHSSIRSGCEVQSCQCFDRKSQSPKL